MPIDPSKIKDGGDWVLVEVTEDFRRWHLDLGNGQIIQRTEIIAPESFLAQNKEEYKETEGQKFGDFRKVGSVPLNLLYSSNTQLAEKMKEGDQDHLKWWLNRDENLPFRTFKGKL